MKTSHTQARIIRIEEYIRLANAADAYFKEAHTNCLVGDATCDHAVGVCWCDYRRATESLEAELGKARKVAGRCEHGTPRDLCQYGCAPLA